MAENTASDVEGSPRGRPARFEDVAAPLSFFSGDDAGYISGDDVSADGGRLPELSAQPSRGDPDGSRSNSPGTEDL